MVVVCGQVPSREVDKDAKKLWTHWNKDTKQVSDLSGRLAVVDVCMCWCGMCLCVCFLMCLCMSVCVSFTVVM